MYSFTRLSHTRLLGDTGDKHRKAPRASLWLPEFSRDDQARGQTTVYQSHHSGPESSRGREVLEKTTTWFSLPTGACPQPWKEASRRPHAPSLRTVAETESSPHALKRDNYLKGPDANTQALPAEGLHQLAQVWPERVKALLPVCRWGDHKPRKAEMALRC